MAFKGNAQSEITAIEADIVTLDQQIMELRKRKADLEHKKKDAVERLKASQQRDHGDNWEAATYPWSSNIDLIRTKMKIKSFRHLQLSTINATLAGKDCILIMPTGGGKSLCYQIPASLSKGITIVISPLVSLMEDQQLALEAYGIEGAVMNGSTSAENVRQIYANMLDHNSTLKIIYVTPERIAQNKSFNMKMDAMHEIGRLSRFVIDEIHCCSQWGHDFRTDYKALNILKRQYPRIPILGLTATATVRVLRDVQDMLGMQGAIVFRASFNRNNLVYEVHYKPASRAESMNALADLIRNRFNKQSGIVYCMSVKDTEEVARDLVKRGIKAKCYHAQLKQDVRSKTHRDWLKNKVFVVVATIAFGMGIDKPDVRFVIHHTLSKSIDAYYQESGRAGRDGQMAHCILFYRMQDIFRLSALTYSEKVGEANLRGMVAYAQNISTCRRTQLAMHFEENWTAAMCSNMCDMCKKSSTRNIVSVDVTSTAVQVMDAIEIGKKQSKFGKCTAVKLMDAWIGKESKARPKLGDIRVATREDCERIVVELVLSDYLTLSYNSSSYGFNCYLQPGARWKTMVKNHGVIEIEFEMGTFSPPLVAVEAMEEDVTPVAKKKSRQSNSKKTKEASSPTKKIGRVCVMLSSDEEEDAASSSDESITVIDESIVVIDDSEEESEKLSPMNPSNSPYFNSRKRPSPDSDGAVMKKRAYAATSSRRPRKTKSKRATKNKAGSTAWRNGNKKRFTSSSNSSNSFTPFTPFGNLGGSLQRAGPSDSNSGQPRIFNENGIETSARGSSNIVNMLRKSKPISSSPSEMSSNWMMPLPY